MSKISHTVRLKQRLKRQLKLARQSEGRVQMTLMTVLAQLGGNITLTKDAMLFVQHQAGLAWNAKPGFTGQEIVLQLIGVGGVSLRPEVQAPALHDHVDEEAVQNAQPSIPLPERTPLPIGNMQKKRHWWSRRAR